MLLLSTELAKSVVAASNPVSFHHQFLEGELPALDAWQEDACRNTSANMLLLCGRQTGKSTWAALMAIWRVTQFSNQLVLLVSPTQRQSTELYSKAMVLFDALSHNHRPGVDRRTKSELELFNGSRLVSLPGGNPDSIRGFSKPSLVIEDEAAFVMDGTFRATRPMLATSRGGRHILLTTPFGRRGHFYNLWELNSPRWSRFMIKSASCPRITDEFLEGEREALSRRSYEQEYECNFLESAISVFPYDMIERLVDDNQRSDGPDQAAGKRKEWDLSHIAVDPGPWDEIGR